MNEQKRRSRGIGWRAGVCMFALAWLGLAVRADAVMIGDLVFCDVDGNGVFDPNASPPDYPLDGVAVHISCLSRFGHECFAATGLSGQPAPDDQTAFLSLCHGANRTWDPTVDLSGRYLFHPYPACGSNDAPWTCTVTLDPATFPADCASPSIPILGGPPIDGDSDGVLCTVGTDGPFPEGQTLGNTYPGHCVLYPDAFPPADLTYSITVEDSPFYLENCIPYADFGLTPGLCTSDQQCDDGDPCTDDVCDPNVGCTNPFNQAPCDDGDPCTAVDVCDGAGTCTGSGSTCGDGTVQGICGEQCDDGTANSDTTADACRTDCTLPFCGDGVIDSGEECDDGGANSDTTPGACRTNCSLPSCGDGIVDPGEECDDGTANSDTTADACRTTCTNPFCGDSVIDSGETCDDGQANSDTTPDACRTTCEPAFCGDGVVDAGEECDDGSANSDTTPDACRVDCTLPLCGDGVIDSGESCDDGPANSDSAPDACRTDCTPHTCGDGVVDSDEDCEPQPGAEICDDTVDNDGDNDIDCDDADCQPGAATPGCGQSCVTVECKRILRDPALIRSLPGAGQLGFLRLHGRVPAELGTVDWTATGFTYLLSNAAGVIYTASIPGEAFQRRGRRRFRFVDKAALTGVSRYGGLYRVSGRYRREGGRMYFSFRIKAYADYSLATLAEMTTQVYGVDHVGFIRATWTKTKRGWVLRNKNR